MALTNQINCFVFQGISIVQQQKYIELVLVADNRVVRCNYMEIYYECQKVSKNRNRFAANVFVLFCESHVQTCPPDVSKSHLHGTASTKYFQFLDCLD